MGTVRIGGVIKNSPSSQFWLEADWVATDPANNRSLLRVWLRNAVGPSGSTGSFFGDYGEQVAFVNGDIIGAHSGRPFMPGGFGQNQTRWHDSYDRWFQHDANGFGPSVALMMDLNYGPNRDRFYGSIDAPGRIARPPSPPTIVGVSSVKTNSFGVTYRRGGDNGAGITRDQAQWATDGAFNNVVWDDFAATGYSDPQGGAVPGAPSLTPGTTYSVRVRSENAAGWSGWSSTISQTTIPASAPGFTVTPEFSGRAAALVFRPPGGVSGPITYVYEFRVRGTSQTTSGQTGSNNFRRTGLVPGTAYEWRARSIISGYTSPWTGWVLAIQPAPNTNPGQFFDGNSPSRPGSTYAWEGAANNSRSLAVAKKVLGWMSFNEGNFDSGGTGVVHQAVGGLVGTYATQVTFFQDAVAPGFVMGVSNVGAGEVVPRGRYFGSIHVLLPNRSQVLSGGIAWFDADKNIISFTWAAGVSYPQSATWTRIVTPAVAPENAAYAAPVIRDARGDILTEGYGEGRYGDTPYGGVIPGPWEPWRGGDTILMDAAMVTLSELYPYFDGDTTDTREFVYAWEGTPHNSPSTRTQINAPAEDPLADPDCVAPPPPPMPPSIPSDCIDEVGVWRRYIVQIPPNEVLRWATTLPTLTLGTGGFPARQVRIRIYPNPLGLSPELLDTSEWEGELILTYVPPQTRLTLDGVTQRVWAEVGGGDPIPANHLLYGTNGVPATWPEFTCGYGYVISLDVPLDAPEGNLSTEVLLTQKV